VFPKVHHNAYANYFVTEAYAPVATYPFEPCE
jgi:hypothetical protein